MSEPYDLLIKAGAVFERRIEWLNADGTPRSLAGLKARMQIRAKVADEVVALEATDDNGRLVMMPGGVAHEINLRLGADVTAALPIKAGVYDLEVFDPLDLSSVWRLLDGKVTVTPNVTR